ncbi:MAG TPA: agmatine deiminase family protein [Phycicoccus elongatus]|nr:agmatine deiminase family protein [Phycicoccus elongatus]
MSTWTMPPEWEPHTRTWMAWPPAGPISTDLDDAGLADVRKAWADVARAVARFEPVTMVVDPADVDTVRDVLPAGVDVLVAPLDDAWMRDMGPTFVRDGDGSLAAVSWVFNGWGAQEWARWDNDARVGGVVAAAADVPVVTSALVNEGGGIHVDGRGTVLVTRTVQLDPGRNPGWTAAQVEEELARTIGARDVVWIERGLTRDYGTFGTRGHVDIVAAFAGPDVVLVHDQRDPAHPDHAVSAEVIRTLEECGRWRVIPVPAPTVMRDEHGWVDYSYINHYVCNGGVVLCAFDDPHDEVAREILAAVYPDREVVLVDSRTIFSRGGGVHCITQQEPAARP